MKNFPVSKLIFTIIRSIVILFPSVTCQVPCEAASELTVGLSLPLFLNSKALALPRRGE